jgi:hypothetical protein
MIRAKNKGKKRDPQEGEVADVEFAKAVEADKKREEEIQRQMDENDERLGHDSQYDSTEEVREVSFAEKLQAMDEE